MIVANCIICLNNFLTNDDIVAIQCGHIYHNDCINTWFKNQLSCPTCRCKQIGKQRVKKLFLCPADENFNLSQNDDRKTIETLKSTILKLNNENKILTDNNEKLSKDYLDSINHQKVITSSLLAVSREYENIKSEQNLWTKDKINKENELLEMTKQLEKYKLIDSIYKNLSNEISTRIEIIKNSNDISFKLDVISTAIVLSEKLKCEADQRNTELIEEIKEIKNKYFKMPQQITKLRESLAALQNDDKYNKIQIEAMEKYFTQKNIDTFKLNTIEKDVHKVTNNFDTPSDSLSNDSFIHPPSENENDNPIINFDVSLMSCSDNPFKSKNKRLERFKTLSIMRNTCNPTNGDTNKVLTEWTNQPTYAIPKMKKFSNISNMKPFSKTNVIKSSPSSMKRKKSIHKHLDQNQTSIVNFMTH